MFKYIRKYQVELMEMKVKKLKDSSERHPLTW